MAPETTTGYLYFHQRVHMLYRALGNQQRWEQARRQRCSPALIESWVDASGALQQTVLDRAFLTAHQRLIGVLIADLQAWGPAGRDAVALLAPDHIPDCP
ncbi:MAG: hypothetical protein QM692_22250 [Thermomicrobiales bacterium]